MNINVTYVTDSDMGAFYSEAKLDCVHGIVFDIEAVEDEDAESIEEVFSTYISFEYKEQKFELDVDPQSDEIMNYKESHFYKLFSSEKMKKELEKELEEKSTKTKKMKV